jgi:hypothetical protein
MRKNVCSIGGLCVLAALAFLPIPAQAQEVSSGIDVWVTGNSGNTAVDFTDNPIPAGFFCTGSAQFAQRVPLKGVPIVTIPAGVLGQTDTIVRRLSNVYVAPGGQGTTDIRAVVVSFESISPIQVTCGGTPKSYKVRVSVNQTPPEGLDVETPMTIHRASSGSGGTFDSTLVVPGKLTFIDTSDNQPLKQTFSEVITLQTSGAAWADDVGANGIDYPYTVTVDVNGDGTPDRPTVGTTPGFAPGWCCNPPVPVPVHNGGPHPVLPVPSPPACHSTLVAAVERFEASSATLNNNMSSSSATATPGSEEDLEAEAESSVNVTATRQFANATVAFVDHTTAVTPCLVHHASGSVTVVALQ